MKETENSHPNPRAEALGWRNLAGIDTKLLNLESLREINQRGKAGWAGRVLILS
jgi:hypothetical protein